MKDQCATFYGLTLTTVVAGGYRRVVQDTRLGRTLVRRSTITMV